ADRLLALDFQREMQVIFDMLPKKRHTMLFSATMTSQVSQIQRTSLKDPVKVEVSSKYGTVSGLTQEMIVCPAKYKIVYGVWLLNELKGKTMIIFANCIKTVGR
ncbi:hypothetical protein KIPB_016492, partial [Kipferlia bialata]